MERVRSNLHVVMCMSPVGEPFRQEVFCRLVVWLNLCTNEQNIYNYIAMDISILQWHLFCVFYMVKSLLQIHFKLYLHTCFKHKFDSLNTYPKSFLIFDRCVKRVLTTSLDRLSVLCEQVQHLKWIWKEGKFLLFECTLREKVIFDIGKKVKAWHIHMYY